MEKQGSFEDGAEGARALHQIVFNWTEKTNAVALRIKTDDLSNRVIALRSLS